MKKSFDKELFNCINDFRANPKSLEKECRLVYLALRRLNPNSAFLEDMEIFLGGLPTLSKLNSVTMNKDLCKYAKKELDIFIKEPNKFKIPVLKGRQLQGLISDGYLGENPGMIFDKDADEPKDVLPKILLNKFDEEKIGRGILTDPEYSQIGIAHKLVDDVNYVVILFANNYVLFEDVPNANLSELKKVFDLLDYQQEGRIRINDSIDAMKALEYDKTDPVLFDIMNDLTDSLYIGWPRFATTVYNRMNDRSSNKGLYDIFQIFKDDNTRDTLSIADLRKVCEYLGIHKSDKELNEILTDNLGNYKGEVTFERFCEIMKKK